MRQRPEGACLGAGAHRCRPTDAGAWRPADRRLTDGDVSFNRALYGARVMLVIGEERRGLTAEQRALCDQLVRIPMQHNLDSLNAAVVGSLLSYEVLRPATG
jgi:tRNA C32,U32 (ribose-2'-O)-methylase TrmJ